MSRDGTSVKLAAGLAVGFGALTVVSGGSTLLGAMEMGAVVPFVLWFNFLAGFAYILGGVLLWRGSRWAFPVALAIAVATAAIFAALGLRIATGGAFEMRTVGAMTLRLGFWAGVALVAYGRRREAT